MAPRPEGDDRAALEHPGPWVAAGACHGLDPALWYPENGESGDDAKRICGTCTVREPCLELALGNRERYGIWGGLTETERRPLLRRRNGPRPHMARVSGGALVPGGPTWQLAEDLLARGFTRAWLKDQLNWDPAARAFVTEATAQRVRDVHADLDGMSAPPDRCGACRLHGGSVPPSVMEEPSVMEDLDAKQERAS